jgi:hypothetical protein
MNWFDHSLEIFLPKSYYRSVLPQCNFFNRWDQNLNLISFGRNKIFGYLISLWERLFVRVRVFVCEMRKATCVGVFIMIKDANDTDILRQKRQWHWRGGMRRYQWRILAKSTTVLTLRYEYFTTLIFSKI